MKKQIGLYLFCGLFLWEHKQQRPPFSWHNPRYHSEKAKDQAKGPLSKARAYVLGEKFHLSRKERKAHRKLHLLHLFTPSGLHLSALLFIPALFLRRRRKVFLALLALIWVIARLGGAPPSFQRMCTILGLAKITRRFQFSTVVLGMFLDFFLFGGGQHPLSWGMSFLFLGTLVLQLERSKRSLFMGFMGGQALVGLVFQQAVYPLGLLGGQFLTALFPFFFPFFALESFLVPQLPASALFLFIVQKLSLLAGPSVSPLSALSVAFLYFSPLPRSLFLALLLLFPPPLENLPRHRQKKAPFPTSPPSSFSEKKYYLWGTEFRYQNGMVCRSRPYRYQWSTRCRMGKK